MSGSQLLRNYLRVETGVSRTQQDPSTVAEQFTEAMLNYFDTFGAETTFNKMMMFAHLVVGDKESARDFYKAERDK